MPDLQERAQQVLSNILHQYTRFSVSTIDSFFQQIVRGFAQELGLQSGFSIEMDQEHVMASIVNDLITAAGQDEQLRAWLVEFAEDKLLSGKNWDFKRELAVLGNELFNETFNARKAALLQATHDKAILRRFVQQLYQHVAHFEIKLQDLGKQALVTMQQADLEVTDFSFGKSGVAGYLAGLATKQKFTPTQRALSTLQHLEGWYSKKSDKQQRIVQVVQGGLQSILKQVVQFYQTHHRTYHTALSVRHFLYTLGIITQLLDRLNDYRAAHNVMLISDASLFLRKVIAENETPFVYEKIGAFYKHFLIDEFQDISSFQWHNFKLLIENGMSEGYMSLVVGDIKQSIYRWRNSDWKLLLTKIEEDINPTTAIVLNQNWRSKQHIIDFNNTFFTTAVTYLVKHLESGLETLEDVALKKDLSAQAQQLRAVYQDVYQYMPPKYLHADKGYVNITFLEDTLTDKGQLLSWREAVKARLPLLIESLQKDGFALKDIVLLVRNNAEGREIFHTLMAYQHSPQAKLDCRYETIFSEALYLSHNPWVNILVNALKCLNNETDQLAQAELLYLYQLCVLKKYLPTFYNDAQPGEETPQLPEAFFEKRLLLQQLSLYELVEALISLFQLRGTEETPFLQAFQDVVLDFSKKEMADINGFLAWWKEKGYKHTLPRAEEQDAMSIMTIHQAKGLQFKAVILPFCEWDFDHNLRHPPTLWCHTDHPPFSKFPVLPLQYTRLLKDTVFAREYYAEQMQAHLDNLNLLYVAFTRPQDRLYVFTLSPKKSTLKTTADLLHQTFSQEQQPNSPNSYLSWKNFWDADKGVLELGQAIPLPQPSAQVAPKDLQQYTTRNKLHQLVERKDYFSFFTTLEEWAVEPSHD